MNRNTQLLSLVVLGLGLILVVLSESFGFQGLRPLIYVMVFCGIVFLLKDDPKFRDAIRPPIWIEKRLGTFLLWGIGLVVGAFAWLLTVIVLQVEYFEASFLLFMILLVSGVLLAGAAFYTWLTRVLLGKQ